MDRLKYRVWLKSEKRYIDDCLLLPNGSIEADLYGAGYYDDMPYDSVVVEFCTGIKDANDKLIFEGDIILEQQNGYSYTYRIAYSKTKMRFVCVMRGYDCYEYTISCMEPSKSQIIGDIHHNPELMKEQDLQSTEEIEEEIHDEAVKNSPVLEEGGPGNE